MMVQPFNDPVTAPVVWLSVPAVGGLLVTAAIIKLVCVESTVRAVDSSSTESFWETWRPAAKNAANNGESVDTGFVSPAVGADKVTSDNNRETPVVANGFGAADMVAVIGEEIIGLRVGGVTSTTGVLDCLS
jgi:hypothetical protein